MSINEGDIVERISYGRDIIFVVDRIIITNYDNIAILNGLTIRITADSPITDLELVTKDKIEDSLNNLDKRIEEIVKRFEAGNIKRKLGEREIFYTGKILHLDGDRRYSEKSIKYYRQLGLDAVVKNIPENKQVYFVRELLERYKPDILIITGHDSMIKKGTDYNNIYNYRNSKHFANTVKEARKWGKTSEELVIFAGACQSYFEEIMQAGADFASSPRKNINRFCRSFNCSRKSCNNRYS